MRSATAVCSRRTRRPSNRAPSVSPAVRGRATCCSFSVPAMSIGLSTCFDASVARVEENVPLARYTTIGTGGPARWFARPATIEQLQDALRWAKDARRGRSRRSGSARTCSPMTTESRRSWSSSTASWSPPRCDGRRARRGRRCAERCRACTGPATPASAGFEFASAIPGHRRRRRPHERRRLRPGLEGRADRRGGRRRRLRPDADRGRARAVVPALGVCGPERSWRRSGSSSSRARPRRSRRASSELLAQRKAAQPTNKRTFGSVFKNSGRRAGSGADDRGMRAQGPSDRRRAHLAAPRELHRELGRGDERGLPRVDGRGAQTGARPVRGRARARGAVPRAARASAV